MINDDSISPRCPVGAERCPILDEVVELRHLVSQLSELIRTDGLTGLYNFRFLLQTLELEMERTRRSRQPTGLVMLDLDHFKQINDSWGHEAGNRALVHLAQIMRQSLRKFDIPCRYGGEEFAIVLAGTDLVDSIRVAERLRKKIATTPLKADETEIALRASFGLEVFDGREEITAEELIQRADAHLYRAKEEGRNRVCHPPLQALDAVVGVGAEERRGLWAELAKEKPKKGA